MDQYGGTRPLAAKLSAARSLHDRLIAVDGAQVWVLTQSLNGFAVRSPATIIRTDAETAGLKIAAYAVLWNAAPLCRGRRHSNRHRGAKVPGRLGPLETRRQFGHRNRRPETEMCPAPRARGEQGAGTTHFSPGCRPTVTRPPRARDWLAVQAVCCELVSVTEFPVRREETGNFRKNRGFWADGAWRKCAVAQGIGDEIPYAKEQGIFSIPAGNIRERSGI